MLCLMICVTHLLTKQSNETDSPEISVIVGSGYTCNPRTWETQARSPQVQGQPYLNHSRAVRAILSQNTTTNKHHQQKGLLLSFEHLKPQIKSQRCEVEDRNILSIRFIISCILSSLNIPLPVTLIRTQILNQRASKFILNKVSTRHCLLRRLQEGPNRETAEYLSLSSQARSHSDPRLHITLSQITPEPHEQPNFS